MLTASPVSAEYCQTVATTIHAKLLCLMTQCAVVAKRGEFTGA